MGDIGGRSAAHTTIPPRVIPGAVGSPPEGRLFSGRMKITTFLQWSVMLVNQPVVFYDERHSARHDGLAQLFN